MIYLSTQYHIVFDNRYHNFPINKGQRCYDIITNNGKYDELLMSGRYWYVKEKIYQAVNSIPLLEIPEDCLTNEEKRKWHHRLQKRVAQQPPKHPHMEWCLPLMPGKVTDASEEDSKGGASEPASPNMTPTNNKDIES